MWQSSNPITQTIDEDCENILKQLKDHQDSTRKQIDKIKEIQQDKGKIKDLGIKTELEGLIRQLKELTEKDGRLIGDMTQVRSLYNQKKKYVRLKMEVPGEIMNRLVEKVVNIKSEKFKSERQREDIYDDYEQIKKDYIKNPLQNAGKSILKKPSMQNSVASYPPKKPAKLTKGPVMEDNLSKSLGVNMINSQKNPRQFTDYLSNYESELSKSLLVMEPGSLEFQKRMQELSKISEMKNSFAEYDAREQLMKQRGLDEAKKKREARMRELDPDNNGQKLRLINDQAMINIDKMTEDNENIKRLQNRLIRMDETVRGMEDLVREKEKLASLQRQKYEMLERERGMVEIERIRADREAAEADHMRRLQRMNMELDYVEQIKTKTMNTVTSQLKEFTKLEETRLKNRLKAEKDFQKQKLVDMQREFMVRERKRQAQFDGYLLHLEQKMGVALKAIQADKIRRLKNIDVDTGMDELLQALGISDGINDPVFEENIKKLLGDETELKKRILALKQFQDQNKDSESEEESEKKSKKKKKKKKSKKTVSRRDSQRKVKKPKKKKKETIEDDERDPESVFVYVHQLKNLPANFTYTLIASVVFNVESEESTTIFDDKFCDENSDSLNPHFKQKYKIPLESVEEEKTFFYGEIKTLDNTTSDLLPSNFGCFVIPISKSSESTEGVIYFDSYNQDLIGEYLNGGLELHTGCSVTYTVGTGKVNTSTKFRKEGLLQTKYQQFIASWLSKRASDPILPKVKKVFETEENETELNDMTQILQLQLRQPSDADSVNWLNMNYYVPLQIQKSNVYVNVKGFIFTREGAPEILYARVMMNPDKKGKDRKIAMVSDVNWESKIGFQLMDHVPIQFPFKQIQDNSSIVVEVISVKEDGNGETLMDVIGLTLIPLKDEDGNFTFGMYVLPVFDLDLDWDSLGIFGNQNVLISLANIHQDQDILFTGKFVLMRIGDKTREVSLNCCFEIEDSEFLQKIMVSVIVCSGWF